jgi:hypothetical protein
MRSLLIRDKPTFSSERMLHKDFDRKGSFAEKKVCSREPRGGWRQDERIGCKPPVVQYLWLWLLLLLYISTDKGYSWWCWNKAALVPNVNPGWRRICLVFSTSRWTEDRVLRHHIALQYLSMGAVVGQQQAFCNVSSIDGRNAAAIIMRKFIFPQRMWRPPSFLSNWFQGLFSWG